MVLALGDYMSVQCHACIGGTNVGEDIRKLDYGQHIVSGTPGRVFGKAPTMSTLVPVIRVLRPLYHVPSLSPPFVPHFLRHDQTAQLANTDHQDTYPG